MINRYSKLSGVGYKSFLTEKLKKAESYDRIAGYFSSSILEVAGEELESITGKIRIVCNSTLDPYDFQTAQAARDSIRKEWCISKPEEKNPPGRYEKLYKLLKSEKLRIKVLPDSAFGLIHGKAGVIKFRDGSSTSFLGSINETYNGWKVNYELIWEDDSNDAVKWVQNEFDILWNNKHAVDLPEFIINDLERLSKRKVINLKTFLSDPKPEKVVVESPVNRNQLGLWAHQKYFVKLAFENHRRPTGSRFILADMVGLGKTIQLGMTAKLIGLTSNDPILIIVPKPLLFQWQNELKELLNMPSAIWDGKNWLDENNIIHPGKGYESIKECPRKTGIVSQSLFLNPASKFGDVLLKQQYSLVIVDEAHRARRKGNLNNLSFQDLKPNNLMSFLIELSAKTHSMLLATATPIQLHPVEAADLLYILNKTSSQIYGDRFSSWFNDVPEMISIIKGDLNGFDEDKIWKYLRNPVPFLEEDDFFRNLRAALGVKSADYVLPPNLNRLNRALRDKIEKTGLRYLREFNPFIRFIVRRSRKFLEESIDPETKMPFLPKIDVKTFGENDDEAIDMDHYFYQAYEKASEFTKLVSKRVGGLGFIKMLLLKRIGSSIRAGLKTANALLNNNLNADDIDEDDEAQDYAVINDDSSFDLLVYKDSSTFKKFEQEETQLLGDLIEILSNYKIVDEKLNKVIALLEDGDKGKYGGESWLERGCIIFSQYYDSAFWLAEELSKKFINETIGLYAGGFKSKIFLNGESYTEEKEVIKKKVALREIKLLIGTDAASEGLNLQRLGSLINLDLPWNPTRLEQRKGRIHRLGQPHASIFIYNLRYKDSVEDRVHKILSQRLQNIFETFGQIPDTLSDVWTDIALADTEQAAERIRQIPASNPFISKYEDIEKLKKIDWETCSEVLNKVEEHEVFMKGWD